MTNKEDAIDVEFETVLKSAASPLAKQSRAPVSGAKISPNGEQLSVFGKKPNDSKQKGMSLPVFTLVASICSVTAFYFSGGNVLFQQAPVVAQSTKSALQFHNISTNRLARSGNDILTIKATIVNTDKIAHILPPVIIHLGKDPETKRMFRINRGETINPGERLMFTNSLPVGKGNFEEFELTFAE